MMIARSTLYSSPGGDTTQLDMTAKYLREAGINVDVRLSNETLHYADYDLLHFFNIIRPDDILPHISKANVPYVVSTIFVDYYEYERKNRKGIAGTANKVLNRDQIEYVKSIVRMIKNGERVKSMSYIMGGHRRAVRFVAQKAAILLPNSHSEYNRFVSLYNVSQQYRKVVNAVDHTLFATSVEASAAYKSDVLCVGRIEGRKNQLNLIKALIGTTLNLTIVGKPSPNHLAYYEECRNVAAAAKNIQFIDHINHDELAALYKAAKVHVLPSWFETTGLSSLEAAAMGCNVVITDKGDAKEYFSDMAYYCQPDDINSIRDAVVAAYTDPVNPNLQSYVLENYTWQNAALQTLEAYRSIIEK